MSKQSHTPGPWKYFELDHTKSEDRTYWHFSAGQGFYGKEENGFGLAAHIKEADARLIAAAPDMYEALISVLNSDMAAREEDEGQESTILNDVRRAILKAEGETTGERG